MKACYILGHAVVVVLMLQIAVVAQTPSESPAPKNPQESPGIIPVYIGDRSAIRRRLQAEREAWNKTPQGKRALEREEMVKRADELISKNQFSQARTLFNTVLTEAPNELISSRANEGLGEIARLTGDNASALRYYRAFVSVKPGQTWITSRTTGIIPRLKYALILRDAGLHDEAWESYEIAIKDRTGWSLPKPPDVTRRDVPTAQFVFVVSLSLAERLQGNDDAQAMIFARDAVRVNPASGLPHYYLGKILYKQDEFASKAEFEKAVKYGHGDYANDAKDHLHYWKKTGGPKPKKVVPPVTEVSPESKPDQ